MARKPFGNRRTQAGKDANKRAREEQPEGTQRVTYRATDPTKFGVGETTFGEGGGDFRMNSRATKEAHEKQAATYRDSIASQQEQAGFARGAATTRTIQPRTENQNVADTLSQRQSPQAKQGFTPDTFDINGQQIKFNKQNLEANRDTVRSLQEQAEQIKANLRNLNPQEQQQTLQSEIGRGFGISTGAIQALGIDWNADDPFAMIRLPDGTIDQGLLNERLYQGGNEDQAGAVGAAIQKYDQLKSGTYVDPEQEAQAQALEQGARDIESAIQNETQATQEAYLQKEQEMGVDPAVEAVVQQETAGMNSALANIAKDSPEAQTLLPYIQQYQDSISQQMIQDREFTQKLIEQNQSSFQDSQAKIDKLTNDYKASANMIQDLLEEAKEDSDEQLAIQQESQQNQLTWAEEEERMKLKKLQYAQHEAAVVNIALNGGFGQPAAIASVMEGDRYFEEQFQKVKRAYRFKRTDIAARFSALFAENKQNYIQSAIENIKESKSNIERLTLQGINNTRSYEQAEQSIMQSWFARENENLRLHAKAQMDGAQMMIGMVKEKDQEERQAKADARENLVSAFMDFPAGSSMRSMALKEAQKAGLDISGIDVNELTIDQMKDMKDAVSEAMFSPRQFDEPQAQALMRSGSIIIDSKLPVAAAEGQKEELRSLLAEGKYNEAQTMLEGIVINDMNGGQYDSYVTRKTIVDSTEPLVKDLRLIQNTEKGKLVEDQLNGIFSEVNERLKEKSVDGKRVLYLDKGDFNWYNKEWQSIRNKFGKDSDPQLQRIFAKVENIASMVINERYGAAVTDGEMARAKEYIAMAGNTLGNMIIKLEEFSAYTANTNANQLGVPIFGKNFKTDQPNLQQIREVNDEMFQEMEKFGTTEEPNDLQSGVYDGRRVTLAPPAFHAFDAASRDFKRDYGVDIRIGSVAHSTFRDQTETIRSMAERVGVPFDESNPNATAAELRRQGHQVADVGGSQHEKGLAVDLYPGNDIVIKKYADKPLTAQEYIALVKPYLERYGLKQKNWGGNDPGNFEYS